MAGFYDAETDDHPWPFDSARTPEGTCWYHEKTGRIVYNDLDFAKAYRRHGGWDLDDSIRVHARSINGRKVFVNVRSPNSMGEYDIKNYVEGTFAPKWLQSDGTYLEFPEISNQRPPYIEELNIKYQYENLSHETLGISDMDSSDYTQDMVKNSAKMAISFRGAFGRRANADMIYFETFKDYRIQQLAPIEAIVDACTQEQSNQALELINEDRENVLDEVRYSNQVIDLLLWEKRAGRPEPGMKYHELAFSKLAMRHQMYCEIYKRAYFDLAQRTPEVIDKNVFSLGNAYESKSRLVVKWFYELRHTLDRDVNETNGSFYQRINDMICDHLISTLSRLTIYDIVLGMASYIYSNMHGNEYKDTVLFQDSTPGKDSIFNFYLEAIDYYGIGQEDWSKSLPCPECKTNRNYRDRRMFQKARVTEKCYLC